MIPYLKNHPFAVDAYFEQSIVVSFAVPKDEIQKLLPPCLEVDHHNTWGFIAVAFVKTRNLRPSFVPSCFGNDFILAGYRIFVRYRTQSGKRLRGLYILKSETDKRKMVCLGNIFTNYSYTQSAIQIQKEDTAFWVNSPKSDISIKLTDKGPDSLLPSESPFLSWKEARRYAGPLPFTFTYNEKKNEVLIIEGLRDNWIPRPLQLEEFNVGYIQTFNFSKFTPANAFIVENIPYHWKKGKKEIWR